MQKVCRAERKLELWKLFPFYFVDKRSRLYPYYRVRCSQWAATRCHANNHRRDACMVYCNEE
jgi:hypothetical protein